MSSFFSERTAEYTLVALFKRAIDVGSRSAVPIFFWKTREGNSISSEIHKDTMVRVIALFARRPKLTKRRTTLSGKLNSELFQFAKTAHAMGIPTIAAFPAVTSLFELTQDPFVLWIPLTVWHDDDMYFYVDISTVPHQVFLSEEHTFDTPSLAQVATWATSHAKIQSWSNAMEHMAELRKCESQQSFFGMFRGYRPVYFLLPIDSTERRP